MGCKCRDPALTQASGAWRVDRHEHRGGWTRSHSTGDGAEGCPCQAALLCPWSVSLSPRPRQHLALPVDADVIGVLPTRRPVHHGCCSLCVEVESLGQAVERTGFHTPCERGRGPNDAIKEREERCGDPGLDNGYFTLGLPTAQLQVPRTMSLPSGGTQGGTQARPY